VLPHSDVIRLAATARSAAWPSAARPTSWARSASHEGVESKNFLPSSG